MLNDMSEAQRSILRSGATREDHLLQPPANGRGAVAKPVAGKLIDAGWAMEIVAPSGAPVWRKDTTNGDVFTLKLTAKGLKAVAVASEGAQRTGKPTVPGGAEKAVSKSSARRSARPIRPQPVTAAGNSRDRASPTGARAPRTGSKLAHVLASLSAKDGATIGELMTATAWLEHTTRAALTGLRHRGYVLSLTRRERGGASVYRIATSRGEAAK
jgi:Protein of unknown function (DUF3489)